MHMPLVPILHPYGAVVLDRSGRIVVHGLPDLGAALKVATTLDVAGRYGPYSVRVAGQEVDRGRF